MKLQGTERRPQNSRGFTVIELMIATVVFGVVLLGVTLAIMQLSRVYYKGITETNVQETARSAVDRISQSIQFNAKQLTVTPARAPGVKDSFCVGDQQYTYIIGYQLTDGSVGANQSRHALVVQDVPGCQSTSPEPDMTNATTKQELLAPGMRLAKMEVSLVPGTTNVFKVNVKVVYGDDTLLTSPLAANVACKPQRAGTQFCAISEITTVVTKRVE